MLMKYQENSHRIYHCDENISHGGISLGGHINRLKALQQLLIKRQY